MAETKMKNAHVWERGDHDWYVEPTRVTEQLLKEEGFPGHTHDPCCGGGNIVKTLLANGLRATGSDLVDRAGSPHWFTGEADFLDPSTVVEADNFIMNPPFFKGKGTEAFIRKAVDVAKGKVAVFTEARFVFGEKRANGIYRDCQPTRIWIVTPRPSCPPGKFIEEGGKVGGGTPDFVWIVYDRAAPVTTPTVGWLR